MIFPIQTNPTLLNMSSCWRQHCNDSSVAMLGVSERCLCGAGVSASRRTVTDTMGIHIIYIIYIYILGGYGKSSHWSSIGLFHSYFLLIMEIVNKIAMLSIPVVRSCGNKCFSSVNFVTFNRAQWNEEPPVGVTVIGLRRKMNFGTETISKSHQKWIVCIKHPPTARLSLGLPHDWQQQCCPYFIIYIYKLYIYM